MLKKFIAFALMLILLFGTVTGVSANEPAQGKAEMSVDNATMMLKDNWHRVTDKLDVGEIEKWYQGFPSKGETVSLPHFPHKIMIPVVWYYNRFTPDFEIEEGQRVIVTFQGWAYYTKIWFNGYLIGENEGCWNKFSFDLTDYIIEGGENLLAVRAFFPRDVGTFRGQQWQALPAYQSLAQHVQQPVYLSLVPEISMGNVFVDTKYDTGDVDVKVILNNPSENPVMVNLSTEMTPYNQNVIVAAGESTVEAAPGLSEHVLTVNVKDFRPWSPDDPYLYTARVSAKAYDSAWSESTTMQTGFKDLRIDEDGYFMLNGERFFVKSMHMSIGSKAVVETTATMADAERKTAILDFYKASGYNMVRFLAAPGMSELLDYCDRIGLLVYQEPASAWNMTDTVDSEALVRREVAQVIERDRNHVSLGIFGILNECYDNRIDYEGLNTFRSAVGALEVVRAYNSDVLVFLGSGRWDNDPTIGSACNPGSQTWDVYLGNEGTMEESSSNVCEEVMGDVHYYPRIPLKEPIRQRFNLYADKEKAVFISESGYSSQTNLVSMLRTFQQEAKGEFTLTGNGRGLGQVSQLYTLYNQYNMASAYATPELLLRDTQVLAADVRGQIFDFIRSNPKYNGYSLTMSDDGSGRGEGVLEGTTDLKDGMYEMLIDGWADTRWCLNIDHYNIYNTQGLDAEIYLSDLGKLEVKEYKAHITVTGDEGLVWEKEVAVTPQRDKNGRYISSVLVFDENIPLTGQKTGTYRINVNLVGTGVSRTRTFWVTDAADLPKLSGTVYLVGFKGESKKVLENSGLTCIELDPENIPAGCTVLLGGVNVRNRTLQAVYKSMQETGTTVVGVNPDAFGNYGSSNLPYGSMTLRKNCDNWLYHYDTMMFDKTFSNGLHDNAMMSTLYYEDVYPGDYFEITTAPYDVFALTMCVGVKENATEGTLLKAPVAGAYEWGEGTILLHTFGIMDSIGMPVADRLMLNLVDYALNEC